MMTTPNPFLSRLGPPPSRNWEAVFATWGKAPSDTEQTKCDNAIRAVRKAIDASPTLGKAPVDVFVQGSYANRTNVRLDSDVDICVVRRDVWFTDYSMSDGLTMENVGYVNSPHTYANFKNDVEAALVSYFGRASVKRGKKAFDVHANTYRVDADVVPAFEHRRFRGSRDAHWFVSGTEIRPDNGGRIVNWPQQNYDNGVWKNDATGDDSKL